jgi:hypothetical protein
VLRQAEALRLGATLMPACLDQTAIGYRPALQIWPVSPPDPKAVENYLKLRLFEQVLGRHDAKISFKIIDLLDVHQAD